MRPYTYAALLLATLLALVHCRPSTGIGRTHSFYYWKTTFNLDSTEWQAMDKLSNGPLYLRLFDVDYSPTFGEPRNTATFAGVVAECSVLRDYFK